MKETQYREPGQDIEVVPVEFDSRGNPRRYEVVRVDNPANQAPMIIDSAPVSPLTPVQPRSTSHVEGTYQDRAWGFSIRTSLLALVTGLALVMGAYFIGGIAGAILLMWFFGGFLAVWLASFVLDTLISSEGSQFLETVFLWQFLKREQSERFRRYGAISPKVKTVDKVFGLIFFGLILLYAMLWLLVKEGVIAP